MHLLTEIKVTLPGTTVLREPSFWERVKSTFGGEVHLETDQRTLTRDVLSLAEQMQVVLRDATVTNVTCLAVDDEVIFFDADQRDHDAPSLINVAREHAARFEGGFDTLRVVFERPMGDLEVLVEATFSARFRNDEPAATLRVGGRIESLRRHRSETQAEAKDRVTASRREGEFLPERLAQFAAFAVQLERGVIDAFAGAKVDASVPRVVVLRPRTQDLEELAHISLRGVAPTPRPSPLLGPEGAWVIDPWDRYYKDLGYVWVDLTVLDDMMVKAAQAGDGDQNVVEVLTASGDTICDASTVEEHSRTLMPVHLAATHDFTEPDARAADLRNYEERVPGSHGGPQHRKPS